MPELMEDSDVIRMAETADAMPMFDEVGDRKLHVTFRMDAALNDAKSREERRPIYEMVEFIKIMVPGDKDTIIDHPVTEMDRMRFPTQYERFKRGAAQVQGAPLSEEPWISKAQVEELKYFGIVTLEQLAGMSDANTQRAMGLQSLKQKAIARLELIKQEEPMNHLQATIDQQNELIKTQNAQLQQMAERLSKLETKKA